MKTLKFGYVAAADIILFVSLYIQVIYSVWTQKLLQYYLLGSGW